YAMVDLGYSSKLIAECEFLILLRDEGRRVAEKFLSFTGTILGSGCNPGLDVGRADGRIGSRSPQRRQISESVSCARWWPASSGGIRPERSAHPQTRRPSDHRSETLDCAKRPILLATTPMPVSVSARPHTFRPKLPYPPTPWPASSARPTHVMS